MLTVLLALAAAFQPPACARPVAPDEAAARRIAEREIAARPPRTGVHRFRLNVIPDSDNPGRWLAHQSVVLPPLPPGQRRSSMRGGGGIEMRIDRCTGAVSNLHYSR